jgi:ATP-dependent Lon protease
MLKDMLDYLKQKEAKPAMDGTLTEDSPQRRVVAILAVLADIWGGDNLVIRAGKMDALELVNGDKLAGRVLALQRLVFEDPTIDEMPDLESVDGILEEIEDEVAGIVARRNVEERLERRINDKMQERHEEYIKEIKAQLIREGGDVENAATQKKLERLEQLDEVKLSRSALELLRPQTLEEIVGQEGAVQALLSKIGSPYPQHVILYGPPGVGKTSAARLALMEARKLGHTPFASDAPFIEVDGTTLRWDPREVTNPLLGSVHDPIYQGARRDLADTGVPEPKTGLVTEAHGGVLFIDEIGELEPMLLNKLLKVLEDKKVNFDSSYYDPSEPNVPKYIRKLFEEGAPADFVLIGATTRDASEINPAIRSRAAEVFFAPLTLSHIVKIVEDAAKRLQVEIETGVPEAIADLTDEGRKAVNIMADAYGMVMYRGKAAGANGKVVIGAADIREVARLGRLSPQIIRRASENREIGRVFGLGVLGYLGSTLEIEAVAFPAREAGKGTLRFNDTAGSMAKDSVFNALAVIRALTGKDAKDYDLHVNIIGGGQIDGPSAGSAITLALISAIEGKPLPQNIALTGEVSIQGLIRPVGGIPEKLHGARQAGVKTVYLPEDNAGDIPQDTEGLEVIRVAKMAEILEKMW